MPEVFVGIGSNIEPERHIPCAIRRLRATFGELRLSPVYRSPAFGMCGDDFLNMVVEFDSDLSVDAIEALLTELEADTGRIRSADVASRTLDLDLLLYGSRVDPARRVPRDDVLRYAFVLGPLADIAPQAQHPLTGEAFASAWRRMAAGGHPLRCLGSVGDL
jgi:2-amino-4-hydroxy-6-hydroxymethyldihydropteridine diphosphokinase